ncbi:MAG: DUF805 domain-containing protein [Alphaproteobacteria bacterium]
MSKPVMSDLFKFSGRRNRKSYLFFLLGVIAIEIVLTAVFGAAGGLAGGMMDDGAAANPDAAGGMAIGMTVVLGVIFLVVVVMSIAVGAQRCRDFGWTGWAMLLVLVPFIGWIFALALIFIPGNQGPNKYGPDPLQEHA